MLEVLAQYEIDGWFKYENWQGTNRELRDKAKQKMREGASQVTLSFYSGTTLFHLQRKGRHF